MTDVEVKKSPNDGRLYKRLVLTNGVEALLIHDPEIATQPTADPHTESDDEEEETSKKAAAAMVVGVGSCSDPEILPGLAHYLEHMLFMGSEKFPDENDYDEYLQQNGGYCNACTHNEYTVYYFVVNGSALNGALDRFAQFFVAPLCLEDSLEREVMAVDSEFALSRQDDSWRLSSLMQYSAKKGHVYQKFTMGSKKSLKEVPEAQGYHVREKLLEFYKAHYSAERMRLVVLGGESLEEMQTWIGHLFSGISSGLGAPISFKDKDYPFEGQCLFVMPALKQLHEVNITFQLPSLISEYKNKPAHYISHLIGHEGPGSLLSELKRRGWVVELCASERGSDLRTCVSFFEISMTLTEKGLHASPGYGLGPVALLFSYISMVREETPQQWIYDEIKRVQAIKVKFLEETESGHYVTQICSEMLYVQPGDELLCDYMHEEWDPKRVAELLCLMHPMAEGLRIDLQTSDFESLSSEMSRATHNGESVFVEPEKLKEPWYEFDYAQSQLHPDFLKSLEQQSIPAELHLPPKNLYIPTDFTLHSAPEEVSEHKAVFVKPDLLTDEPGLRVWHKVDALHKTPKINLFFQLCGPNDPETALTMPHATPKATASDHLLMNILEDVLTEECYMAEMAGLRCATGHGVPGAVFEFSGFSEKLPLLVKTVFQTFAHLKVEQAVFERVKEELVRKYENANTKIRKHCSYLRIYALTPQQWHVDTVLKELRNLTPQDLHDHLQLVLKDGHIEALVYGNIQSEEAMVVCRGVRQTIGKSALHASDRKLSQCLKLPSGLHLTTFSTPLPLCCPKWGVLFRAPSKLSSEENSAIEAYFQCGLNDLVSRSKLDLIDQICAEPCFNILRTKEQLGYDVHSRARLTHGVLGFSITVVSERFPPNYLESRVEAFLQSFEQHLGEISDEELEKHRSALIAEKLEKEKNLRETSANLWAHVTSRLYDFDAKHQEVQIIRHLTKQDLLEWYQTYLCPTSDQRLKLSVCVICPGHEEKETALPQCYNQIENLDAFRAAQERFPEPSATLQ